MPVIYGVISRYFPNSLLLLHLLWKTEREKGDTILSLASDLINCVWMCVGVIERSAAAAIAAGAGKMQYFSYGYCSINRPIHVIGWWNVSFGILFVAFLLASFWYIWIKEFHIKSAQILISQYAIAMALNSVSMRFRRTALFSFFRAPPKPKKVYLFLERREKRCWTESGSFHCPSRMITSIEKWFFHRVFHPFKDPIQIVWQIRLCMLWTFSRNHCKFQWLSLAAPNCESSLCVF